MGRRLTLVVPSLQYGGAERVVARMADHWAAAGDQVTVITLSDASSDTYSLSGEVTRIPLGLMRESRGPIQAIEHNIVRIQRLRAAIARSKPDMAISFTDRMNVLAVLACRPLGVDTVVCERIDPGRHKIGRAWSWLRHRVYPSAKALVVQTERVRRQMEPLMRGRPVFVVPNAVWTPNKSQRDRSTKTTSQRTVVALGRLAPQKGFDLLIDAFSRIAARRPEWSLKIVGEGPERDALERLVISKQLQTRVTLPGWDPDPEAVFANADLFVLSSRYEGFPNALLEAMAVGLPVVSFDCDSGPAAIIRDGVDGVLVPPEDVARLADAMDRLMQDEPHRRRMAREAAGVAQRFSVERYFEQWDAILSISPTDQR